ncbi:Mid1p [Sugiyamaella lignohabitans]|uniref:Mid1p n=1 Tax=Sugiyamaella lignohabitans TaxID=796027 RepID=A0A167CLI7_9ASCO|nr:Mid1p [Sugiyamaella lignohabitans]ANB11854.1 Mid1p [Sugiyamaella lignohabitans]
MKSFTICFLWFLTLIPLICAQWIKQEGLLLPNSFLEVASENGEVDPSEPPDMHLDIYDRADHVLSTSQSSSTVVSSSSVIEQDPVTTTMTIPTSGATPIIDSTPIRFTINPGDVHTYELSGINPSAKALFISLNVCNEPFQSVPFDLPQNKTRLTLFATDTNMTDAPMSQIETELGYASIILRDLQSSTSVIEIAGPKLPSGLKSSSWTYEVIASTKALQSDFSFTSNLYLVDTDFANALFITNNFTTSNNVPTENISDFGIYVYQFSNSSNAGDIRRLSQSFCAVNTEGALIDQDNAQMSNTTRGYGNTMKGQIFVSGLNKSETYLAFLTKPSERLVYQAVNFTTKSDTNCQVIFDLDFCSGVAFAVPGNASAFTTETLREFYDDMALNRYGNFSKSLQNIPCNASAETQYSIMRGCDDCANSYKQWLCAITIPRCTDWSNQQSFLFPRPVGQSRNPEINEVIKPGKYKEILPCADLCYSIVQDCSPDFGFFCPKAGRGLEFSYGQRSPNGDISCSYPGAAYIPSTASTGRTISMELILFATLLWIL